MDSQISWLMSDCWPRRRSVASSCFAWRWTSADASLCRAESAVAVRNDADHIDDHFHADHIPTMAGSGRWHCGRMPDVDVDLFAAAGAEGATAGV